MLVTADPVTVEALSAWAPASGVGSRAGVGSGVGSRAGVGSGISLGAEVGCARFAGTIVVGLGHRLSGSGRAQ